MNFKNLRLRTKILLGIGVPLLLAIALGLISITNIRSMIKTEEWVEHTYQAIGEAERVLAHAVDMETGMRGYLLAGKDEFLEPYLQGEEATYESIRSLEHTVSDNPKQVERLTEVESVLREWQENVTEPNIALRREIGDAETMNDMAAIVKEAKGKMFFDTFRTQIATFISREEELMAQRRKAAEEADAQNEVNTELIGETAVLVERTYRVIADANELLATTVYMETGVRGYLLSGKEEFLEPYQAGPRRFHELFISLSNAVSEHPEQLGLLGELNSIFEEWQEQVAEPEIRLRRRVGSGATMDDLAVLVGQGKGLQYADNFRQKLAAFVGRKEELILQREQAAEEAREAVRTNRQLISDATAWIEHTQTVIGMANQLLTTAVDMETGMRGYLLAGKEEFLEPYNAGHEKFDTLLASLAKTVDDNPAQVALLGDIRNTISEWQEQVVSPQIELRRQIGDAKTMDDMADLIAEARGKQYFDRFRALMKEFTDEEHTLMGQRRDASDRTVRTTITSIMSGIVAALAIGLIVGLVISRDVQRQVGGEPAVIAEIAQNVAEGKLLLALDTRKATGILAALVEMVERLSGIVSDVKNAAENVASGSGQMSSSAEEMSQGATEQAASSEEASSSMEEMAANIRQNAENAMLTEKIARQAAQDSKASGEAVNETVKAMKEIVKQILVIEEIARQTHTLSLNATIEAAKAEQYGKGFAVVASEVRALAERSRLAASEINALAASSVGTAERAGEMLSKLVPDIQKTAELVQEISAASREQDSGANQINMAIQQLDQVVQQNSSTSEEMAATAEELSGQAEMLRQSIDFFDVESDSLSGHQERRSTASQTPHGKNSSARGASLASSKIELRPSASAGISSSIANEPVSSDERGEQKDTRLDGEFERY